MSLSMYAAPEDIVLCVFVCVCVCVYTNGNMSDDAFKLWCWRRLLRVPWTSRGSNQPVLKEINPKYSLEGLMLKLKLQYFAKSQLIRKDPDAGKD